MEQEIKAGSIMMHNETGEILLITGIVPLWGEDNIYVLAEAGEDRLPAFALVNTNTNYLNYSYIGEL